MTQDFSLHAQKLEQELSRLETEMKSVSVSDPAHPGDLRAAQSEGEDDPIDPNDLGSKFESLDDNEAIMDRLEEQVSQVKAALDRIRKGTYGTCIVCLKPIEAKRLEANPSASTCIEHKEQR